MAYKFQLGSAILSGSTKFEELVEAAGGFKPTVADTAAAVADDSFYFQDADGAMKRESMADYATAIAGDGLAASSGVLAVGVDDSTIETNSDALRIKDSGVTAAKLNTDVISAQAELAHADIADADELMISDGGVLKKTGVDSLRDHFFGVVSGDATVADGGALTIAAGAVHHSMLADDIIGSQGELAHADINDDDEMMIDDAGTVKKVGVDSLRDHFFGVVSGDATVADGGALTIAANAVEDSMVNDNVATGLAGVGLSAASGVLALDASELSDAAVASGDKFVFEDATDNSTKKESVDDIATLFAGAGLAASSAVLSVQVSGAIKVTSDKLGISGSFAGIGLSYDGGVDSIEGIDLDLNELSAGAIANGDFFAFVDSNDSNVTKKESVADLATLFAGNGLVAASSVLAVNVDDTGIELNSDALRLKDNGVTLAKMAGIARGSIISGDASGDPQALSVGSAHQFLQSDGTDLAYVSMSGDATLAAGVLSIGATKVTDAMMNDDVATGLAGDGLAASSGVLSVGVDDSTIETNSDALRLKDNGVTGAKLNTDVISAQAELAHADIADADELMISDGGLLKKVGVDSLRDHFFGVVSGDATVADGGALTIAANAVEGSMLNDNAISGQTDIGAAIADTDELLISDAGSLRRTDVSRLRAMAVAERGDGDTLSSGMNYFGDLSSDATVTLPASPEVGDKVVAKAKGLASATIIINKAGSQTIDGEASVTIESPFGAVTMVYVATNDWRLI